MVTINTESALTPRSLRDTRRMNTKNVTLEHIERKLMAGEKLRNIGV
ncbi:hypothetical protein KZL32_002992 [Shigella sonnei]|nr:hypothetical protein [Shigella sonnei]EHU7659420.1 hypothetical protein [Shigella sonnei]SRS97074.1 Arabinose-proton symporter [Shigella sonnei]SRT65632.1 Arabinose-proton symporter [Shigella sonnei]